MLIRVAEPVAAAAAARWRLPRAAQRPSSRLRTRSGHASPGRSGRRAGAVGLDTNTVHRWFSAPVVAVSASGAKASQGLRWTGSAQGPETVRLRVRAAFTTSLPLPARA